MMLPLNIDTTTGRHDFGGAHSNPKWLQMQLTREQYLTHKDAILSAFAPAA